jgi:hypothetical protein
MRSTLKRTFSMIRLNKFFLVLAGFFCSLPLFSQNLFDEANTFKFTDYLFKTQQYNLASQEFERLVAMVPSNLNYKLSLIQCYRLSNNYSFAEKRFTDFFSDSLFSLPTSLSIEFLKIKLLQEDMTSAQVFINKNSKLGLPDKVYYQECIYLLSRQWNKSDSLFHQYNDLDPRFGIISKEALVMRYKSPFLAATFSTLLPGSGKVYSGYWKDGLIAFIFVAANSWQSYRGFSKYGTENAHGWIFGGLAAGFYLGNIYGSWKSAVRRNKKANDELYKRSKAIIYSVF